eukprot:1226502-Amphidinium_carterae.1
MEHQLLQQKTSPSYVERSLVSDGPRHTPCKETPTPFQHKSPSVKTTPFIRTPRFTNQSPFEQRV